MPDTKLSNLSSATPALGDLVYIVDVSDTTDDPAGSSRNSTLQSTLDALSVPYSTDGGSSVNCVGDFVITSAKVLRWSTDCILMREGPNALAQRNGTNPQVYRVYNTYTSDTNKELFDFSWAGNVAYMQTLKGSSGGSSRDMQIGPGGIANLHFQINGSPRWRVDTSTAFIPTSDNSSNLGATSSNRVASLYLANSLELEVLAWIRNHPGRKRLSANATNATATLSSGVLSDLSVTLVAGKKYIGRCVLIANNSTGTEGIQYDFNGGTATMTNFQATAEEAPIGATLGTTNSTSLGTALTNTVVSTSDTVYAVNITLVCNAGGTFIPRFAENSAHVSGTVTVKLGAYLWLEDTA